MLQASSHCQVPTLSQLIQHSLISGLLKVGHYNEPRKSSINCFLSDPFHTTSPTASTDCMSMARPQEAICLTRPLWFYWSTWNSPLCFLLIVFLVRWPLCLYNRANHQVLVSNICSQRAVSRRATWPCNNGKTQHCWHSDSCDKMLAAEHGTSLFRVTIHS